METSIQRCLSEVCSLSPGNTRAFSDNLQSFYEADLGRSLKPIRSSEEHPEDFGTEVNSGVAGTHVRRNAVSE